MTRSEADSWDLASSVGATATMVAAGRALASREPEPLIQDPYAEPLVRAVGIDFFTKLVDGVVSTAEVDDGGAAQLITGMMAVRTRFFDDFFLEATGAAPAAASDTTADIRQAVILASGLDSRAYRLPWPDGTVVYEIDQPAVIEAKTATMADIGATPTADLRAVAVDLRDDWPSALIAGGFRPRRCPRRGPPRGCWCTCPPRRRTGSSTTSPRCRRAGQSTGHRVPPRRRGQPR